MSIKTSRAGGKAEVAIDRARCSNCGLCARVCRGQPLFVRDGRVEVDQNRLFGCIACGHCMAVCPAGAITVEGRDLHPGDRLSLPPREARADFQALHHLLRARRSVREFRPREVDRSLLAAIVEASASAPMGIPPTDVGVLVFAGRERVRAFRDDLLAEMQGWRWMLSPVALALLRPLWGREAIEMMGGFVRQVVDIYTERDRQGEDAFFYDAPAALLYHGTPYCDPADPHIAATYALLAAEAAGLGACMLGFPAMVLKHSRRLKRKYGVHAGMQTGLTLILGHPAVRYSRGVRRRFASVRWW